MSWLGLEEKKDDDKGLPNGYDLLPSLGERDEAPIVDPKQADAEVKKIIADLKDPPAPPQRRLFVWEEGAESLNKILAGLDRPVTKRQAVEPEEQPQEPTPPAVDPFEVRALDTMSGELEQLRDDVAALSVGDAADNIIEQG